MEYEDDILVETQTQEENNTNQETKQNSKEEKKEEISKKQFPKYSNDKLERVYSRYDFSKPYNPNKSKGDADFEKFVKEQDEATQDEESISLEKAVNKYKTESGAKFNLFKVCASAICVLLIILSMINLASITDIEQKINNTENNIEIAEIKVDKLIKDVGSLTSEEEILSKAQNDGMKEVDQEIEIELNDKKQVIEYSRKTNFFDSICNFLSNLFK